MFMWKPAIVGVAALMIAGSTIVLAQNRSNEFRPGQQTMQDMRAFADARLAALKAGLALSPDQEKNWSAFEQAARDFQKLRLDRLNAANEARRSGRTRTANPVERMQQRADALSESGAALKKLADAAGPLYNSLDDNQKRRFAILNPLDRNGATRDRGFPARGFRRGDEREDRGFRRGDEREERGFRRGDEREERGFRRGDEREERGFRRGDEREERGFRRGVEREERSFRRGDEREERGFRRGGEREERGFRRGDEREERGFRRGDERDARGFRRGDERGFEGQPSFRFQEPSDEERL
jgi:LTXXQ motif family protein